MRDQLGKRNWKNIIKISFKTIFYLASTVIVFALIAIVAAVGAGAGIVSAVVKDEKIRTKEDFQQDLNNLFQTSYAYFASKDQNGNPKLIGALRFDNERNMIKSLKEVSPYLIDAFISVEDREFFQHNGIMPRSLLRAAYQQITNSDVTTGGSTITQQLVKNIVLKNREKDIERKAKEIILAMRMERMYTKEQILVYYMNSVFFGRGANGKKMYGVKAAARGLFNKDPRDLTLAQAAYIAGMVQRPNAMNPLSEDIKNYQRGMKRMKLVLKLMLENNKITQKEYDEAIKFDIKKSLAKPSDFKNGYEKYPFIMFALEQEAAETLMEMDGLDIQELSQQGKYRATLEEYKKKAVTGGYRFYTTLDEDLYNAINEAATKGLKFHYRIYNGRRYHEQMGAAIIENKTGAVLAFVPGTEDFSTNQKDHALDVPRQPGSAIKPLLVYGPAINEGLISPNSVIIDEPLRKSDGSGYYRNANGNYKGPVTVLEALKWSYNIPAIKTFNALGHEKGFDYLRKMQLFPHEHDGEAAAIGGMTRGYTVEKMTAAYATFANQGYYNKPYMIYKVTDANGKVIWEKKLEPVQVFSEQTAYQITKILRNVLHGTAAYIGSQLPSGYDVAGKTGTTTSQKDLWFVGYTPEVTIGVWSGYDYNFKMYYDKFTKRAWVNIFKAAMKARPDLFPKGSRFPIPEGDYVEKCGFECGKVAEYKRKEEEKKEQQRKAEERRKQRSQSPGSNQEPSIPIHKPDPEPEPEPEPDPEPPSTDFDYMPDPDEYAARVMVTRPEDYI